jgi:1,4-dihydroxy-2-naphthoate octaprenyltransferase
MSEINDSEKKPDLHLEDPENLAELIAAEPTEADTPQVEDVSRDKATDQAAAAEATGATGTTEATGATEAVADSTLTPSATKAATPKPKRNFSLKAWFQASRPTYFVATFVPLFLGYYAAVVYHDVVDKQFLFALIVIACFLVHLATNLANDLFEHHPDIDGSPEAIGGSRVLQEGRISPKQIKSALLVCYLVAFALAIFIVRTNEILWGLVVFAAFSSFFYVCPPIRYGHRRLGEVFVFINMGLIMTVGTTLALTGELDLRLISLALPVALGVANILFYQSLPEIETDAKTGKKTLAGLLGKDRSALTQLLWWPLIWLLMINLWFSGFVAWPALLGIITLPLHLYVVHKINKAQDWLTLDKHGLSVRIIYLINGILLIFGVIFLTNPPDEIIPASTNVEQSAPAPTPVPAPSEATKPAEAVPAPATETTSAADTTPATTEPAPAATDPTPAATEPAPAATPEASTKPVETNATTPPDDISPALATEAPAANTPAATPESTPPAAETTSPPEATPTLPEATPAEQNPPATAPADNSAQPGATSLAPGVQSTPQPDPAPSTPEALPPPPPPASPELVPDVEQAPPLEGETLVNNLLETNSFNRNVTMELALALNV